MDVERPIIAPNYLSMFQKVLTFWEGNTMQVYWLTDRTIGEATLVDADTVERLLGVELGYVEWCIEIDGVFENWKWRVR